MSVESERLITYVGVWAAGRTRLESTLRTLETIQRAIDDPQMTAEQKIPVIDAHVGMIHKLIGDTLDRCEQDIAHGEVLSYSRAARAGEARPSRGDLG